MRKIITLVLVSGLLTGCATTMDQTTSVKSNGVKPSVKPGLSSAAINNIMTDTDRKQLQHLIQVAKSDEHNTWHNDTTKYQFDFVSTDIFVNDQGQPCRHYTLSASTSGLFW